MWLFAITMTAACVSTDDRLGQTEAALGADCAGRLNRCYVKCQGMQPTPTEQCFTDCGTEFDGCIRQPFLEVDEQ
jgi:hypothetical protein